MSFSSRSFRHFATSIALLHSLSLLSSMVALAAPLVVNQSKPVANPSSEVSVTRPKRMDGIQLEAVETYSNPRSNEVSLGIGVYPFDSYFYGLSINAGYTYHFSRNVAWEILNAQYYYSFQKTLTTELADRYKVNPKSISTLNYIVSSDVQYIFAYGKFTLLEEQIRYFRASALAGLGAVKTSEASAVAVLAGLKFQVFTRDNFSWNVEIRDNLAVTNANNYLTFIVGTGFGF